MPKPEELQALEALTKIGARAVAADDPIAVHLVEWTKARRADYEAMDGFAALERQHGGGAAEAMAYEAEHVIPAQDRLMAAYRAIAATVPTTLAGLAAQLAVHANTEDADRGASRGWHEEQILVSARDAALRLALGEHETA